MNWGSWSEFAAMGGHGLYVWASFAVVAVSLAGELLLLSRRKRRAVAEVRQAGRTSRAAHARRPGGAASPDRGRA